jgi:molybdopterin-biosynthesis enzyme MoeA-like protein
VALSLPDDAERISIWLKEILHRGCRPVLVSGGIGGTHDDCSREGIAGALGVPLTKHEECFRILSEKYSSLSTGPGFTEQRQRMAWLPEGCGLIANPIGAPGFFLGGIYAFPGFPTMLKPMLLQVLPTLLPEVRGEWLTREYVLPFSEGTIALSVEAFAGSHTEARIGIYPSVEKYGREVTVVLRLPQGFEETAVAFDTLIENLRTALSKDLR